MYTSLSHGLMSVLSGLPGEDYLRGHMAPRRATWCQRMQRKIRPETLLLLCTLLSVIMGSVIGLALNPIVSGKDQLTARQITYLKFPGEIFMRCLQAMIVPLVISSNISAICSLAPKAARMLAAMTMLYCMGTTAIAVLIGIVLVLVIQPGTYRRRIAYDNETQKNTLDVIDSILDVTRNLVPDNWVAATFKKTVTKFEIDAQKQAQRFTKLMESNLRQLQGNSSAVIAAANQSYMTLNEAKTFERRAEDLVHGTNILGIIMVSVMFGFAVRSLDKDAAVLAELFRAIRRAMVYLVSIVIWFSPIGIASLIAAEIANTDDIADSISQLYMYVTVMLLGLFVHVAVVLPFLLYIFTKRNPLQFARNMLQALICAVGTASSTATLPCTLRCLESGNNIDPRVTRFMLPLGTTINMDGTGTFALPLLLLEFTSMLMTPLSDYRMSSPDFLPFSLAIDFLAMYEAIAVIYIAQRMGIPLDIEDLILVALTAMLASMAAASMPSAGLLTMAMVLKAVGLPSDKYALIVPVDWFLDRFRTMTNVASDSVGTAIVSKLCEKYLNEPASNIQSNGSCAYFPQAATMTSLATAVNQNPCTLSNNSNASSIFGHQISQCTVRTNPDAQEYTGLLEDVESAELTTRTTDADFEMQLGSSSRHRHSEPSTAGIVSHRKSSNPSARRGSRPTNAILIPNLPSGPIQNGSACVYMVDEETIVLKF